MSQTLDVDRIRELLLDVYQAHRDPQDHDSDWQQAEDVPCAWCDGAKVVLEQIERLRAAHVPAPQGEQEEPVNWKASYHQACDDADAYKADADKRLVKIEQHWRSCKHEIEYLRERLSIAKTAHKSAPAPQGEQEHCRCEHPKSAHYDHDDEGGTSCRRQFCECAAFIPTSASAPLPAPTQGTGWSDGFHLGCRHCGQPSELHACPEQGAQAAPQGTDPVPLPAPTAEKP